MRSSLGAIVVAFAGCASSPPQSPCPRVAPITTTSATSPKTDHADVVSLDAGVVVYDISISKTAQIFHVADQMSLWSPYMHKPYARWADANHLLGDPQKQALDAHRALRQRRGYGDIDHAFYTTKSVQDALIDASKTLSPEDLVVERRLFAAMTPVISPLIEVHQQEVIALRDRILSQQDKLKSMLEDLVRFTETYIPKEHVPLWLIASTSQEYGGGGYNAGQMVVEASRASDNILLHESLHFVLDRKKDELDAAAKSCGAGLDQQTLNEGIAYALYPGIVGKRDSIAQTLANLQSQGKTADDPYVRFNRLGRALVPLLERALVQKTTLAAMLPSACDAWKSVVAEKWPAP